MPVFATIVIEPQGGFWTLPHLVGSSEQEILDMQSNRIQQIRQEALARAISMAANELYDREPLGRA